MELKIGRRYKIPTRYQLTQSILIGVQCIFGQGDALSLMACNVCGGQNIGDKQSPWDLA